MLFSALRLLDYITDFMRVEMTGFSSGVTQLLLVASEGIVLAQH